MLVKNVYRGTIWKYFNHSCINIRVIFGVFAADPGPYPNRDGLHQQLLYCRVGIGFHLQILSNGVIRGIHKPNEFCESTFVFVVFCLSGRMQILKQEAVLNTQG